MGSASPFLTRGLRFPRPARRSARLVQVLQNSFVAPTDAALIRPRSCGRPCFATGYFRFAPIAHILRTIQRDGRDAVGLRSTLAAAFGGALRAVHIPKTERGSFPTKPSLPKNCCARFSAYGGRLALLGTLPRVRGARRALPALAVALTNCRALSVKPRCEDKRIFRGRSSGLVSRSRNEAGFARVGGGRGAEMPRSLLDSVKNGRSFAASASRDRFAHCPSGRLRRWPSASRYFGFAYGEVSLAPLLGHRFATRYRSGDTRSAHFPSPLSQTNQLML